MVARLRAQADDQACGAAGGRPGRARARPADNSYFGEGIVDALDAVTPLTR